MIEIKGGITKNEIAFAVGMVFLELQILRIVLKFLHICGIAYKAGQLL